jgi:hypothetical protein
VIIGSYYSYHVNFDTLYGFVVCTFGNQRKWCRIGVPCLNNRLCCKLCLERFARLDWRMFVLMSVLLHKEGPKRQNVGVAEFVV